jgi:hypothetical protein
VLGPSIDLRHIYAEWGRSRDRKLTIGSCNTYDNFDSWLKIVVGRAHNLLNLELRLRVSSIHCKVILGPIIILYLLWHYLYRIHYKRHPKGAINYLLESESHYVKDPSSRVYVQRLSIGIYILLWNLLAVLYILNMVIWGCCTDVSWLSSPSQSMGFKYGRNCITK